MMLPPNQSQQQLYIPEERDKSLPDTYLGYTNANSTRAPSQRSVRLGQNAGINQRAFGDNGMLRVADGMPAPTAQRAESRMAQRYESLHTAALPDIPPQCLLPSDVSSASGPAPSVNLEGGSFRIPTPVELNNLDLRTPTRPDMDSIHDWIPNPVQPYYAESATEAASLMSRYLDNDIPQTTFTSAPMPLTQQMAPRPPSRQSQNPNPPYWQTGDQQLVLLPGHEDQDQLSNQAQVNKMDIDSPSTADLRAILPFIPDIREHYASKPSLKGKLQNHEERLDHLENASHSVVERSVNGTDRTCDCDCDLLTHKMEKHNCRLERVEKALASSGRFRHLLGGHVDAMTDSFVSSSSTDMTSASHAELYSRVDYRLGEMEVRMSKLDGSISLPSAAQPWEFEVVFLPFGADLTRVWSTADSFGSQMSRRSSANDLTAITAYIQSNASATKFFTQAPRENSWEHQLESSYNKSSILSARACTTDSLIDQRLRSRGLVRSIEVKGPDAQHVQFAIFEAFGDLLATISEGPTSGPRLSSKVSKKLKKYKEALGSAWVPLRKLHRESRLRFLETGEMVTSSLWTPSFLSEVSMWQGGKRRLFVTGRESYVQHENNLLFGSGWTWQAIRQLEPFDENASAADDHELPFRSKKSQMLVLESCWEYDEKLDGPTSHLNLPQAQPTHQTVTAGPMSNIPSHLSISANQSFSIHESFRVESSPENSDSENEHSSSIPSPSSTRSPSPLPSAAANLRIKTGRRSSGGMSPLTSRNAFDNINITTRRWRSTRSPSHDSAFYTATNASGKRGNPYSSIFEDVKPRRSFPLSSSPAKATSSGYLNIKRQRTRSPSRPRDTPRWSMGRSSPSPFIYEDREPTAEPDARKRGMTPFAYATPFSNAPVSVKRERSWGSGKGALRDLPTWDDNDSDSDSGTDPIGYGDEGGGSGDESDFFQPRQIENTNDLGWEGMTDDEGTMRPRHLELPKRTLQKVDKGRGKTNDEDTEDDDLEARALTEPEDSGSSDAPSEYPSTQRRLSAVLGKSGAPRQAKAGESGIGFEVYEDEESTARPA